jgi:phage host-nuclease inhibitor protein Gam
MKKKTAQTTISNWDEANATILKIAACDTTIQTKEAQMNKELQTIRDLYDEQTKKVREEKLTHEINLELFAEAHKEEITNKAKSKDLAHGKIGFSFNPPAVKLLNRKFNWDLVKTFLLDKFKKKYVRESIEINKEKIIEDYNGKLKLISDADLAECGLKIDQKEKFYYKIKWEVIKQSEL